MYRTNHADNRESAEYTWLNCVARLLLSYWKTSQRRFDEPGQGFNFNGGFLDLWQKITQFQH